TVHYIVQSIQQNRATPPGRFDADADSLTGEIRGAALIERSVDPNDRAIPDFAGSSPATTLEAFHRYRVVEDRSFAP
ncbi:MAG TPA: hypothetical protein VMN39_05920, partial [Longimicrobiaceae bacterium]|nr:hypothetical protein [Longimicrobiaceae bacterium]